VITGELKSKIDAEVAESLDELADEITENAEEDVALTYLGGVTSAAIVIHHRVRSWQTRSRSSNTRRSSPS